MRILLTGQSGMRIEQMFVRYLADAGLFSQSQRPRFLKLETQMEQAFLKGKPRTPNPSVWVREVLALPLHSLRALWSQAFEECLKEIKDSTEVIILNLHACFYHSYTVEYISLYSIDQLREFNPDMVVTLIDDAYDIHDRLREPNHIFHPAIAGAANPTKAAFQLMRILDWRSKEVMISRQIAYDCRRIPHFVFATKHSRHTFCNLTSRLSLPKVYLSHPISQIRRLQQLGKVDQANQVIHAIEEIERVAEDKVVLFSPTTIDELRIRSRCAPGEPRRYEAHLTERWNREKFEHQGNLLFIPPQHMPRDPLWNKQHSTSPASKVSDDDVPPAILRVLVDEIGRQISSRDHKLVEQSSHLLIYRPFFGGNVSSGVRKELDYFAALAKANPSERRFCFIFMPQRDTEDLQVRCLEDSLRSTLSLGRELRWSEKKEPFTFSDSELANATVAVRLGLSATVNFLETIVDEHKMDYPDRESLQSDNPLMAPKILLAVAERAQKAATEIVALYRGLADHAEETDDLSSEAIVSLFVRKFNSHQSS